MITIRHPRRATLFAVGLLVTGALAVFGSAPAFSYTQIYGSGAALQTLLQNNILIPKSGQVGGFVTFDSTTSGGGYKEFGNQGTNAGTLEPGEDTKTLPSGALDAYVATDSGPTTGELTSARHAAYGASPLSTENEIAVPVAQTPLDLLLSLPSGVTLASAQHIDLTDLLAGQLYAGTVPAATPYPENTWGALLIDAGLTAGSVTTGQFEDTGTAGPPATGGFTPITVEVRKEGAGTTVNLKQFLPLVDPTDWGSIPVDSKTTPAGTEWPSGATQSASPGTANDQAEAAAVDDTPGTVGYATAGDASANPGVAFTSTPLSSTNGSPASASHQILYALLQDNYNNTSGSRTPPIYADPETNSTGTANIYTGSNIKVNGSAAGGVGSWVIPNTGGTFNVDGTWEGTRGSDPDVYDDSGDSIAYYPLVAIAFDLSWSDFADVNGAKYSAEAQATTEAFFSFATSPAGQADILGKSYYSPLPSDVGNSSLANIQAVAHSAASGI